MMPTYIFHKPHNLSQLHDELLAAIPSVRPIATQDGDTVAVMQVEGRDDDHFLRISVPPQVREADLQAVVNAHAEDPTYGAALHQNESDLLAMNESEFRQWVFKMLLGSVPNA